VLQIYNTFNEYDNNVFKISRHGPQSRFPQSMKQKEEERRDITDIKIKGEYIGL